MASFNVCWIGTGVRCWAAAAVANAVRTRSGVHFMARLLGCSVGRAPARRKGSSHVRVVTALTKEKRADPQGIIGALRSPAAPKQLRAVSKLRKACQAFGVRWLDSALRRVEGGVKPPQ